MAVNYQDLLNRAATIRDAVLPEENTALRVGSLLLDMVRGMVLTDNKIPPSGISGTYLTITDAVSTYLSKVDAAKKYQPKGDYAEAVHSHTFASLNDRPTTLAGYGISDATIDPATGEITIGSNSIVPLKKSAFDELFQLVTGANGAYIRAKYAIYSDGEVGAFGADDSGGSGGESGGGVSYERLDRWADYDAAKAGWVLSAALGADLNNRLTAVEMSLGDFVTSDQLAAKGYLTQASLDDYATQDWVTEQGFLRSADFGTTLDSRYYTETEINTMLGGYVKTSGGSTIAGSLAFTRPGSDYGFYIEALDNGNLRVNATENGQYTQGVFTIEMATRQFSIFKAYVGESLSLAAQSVINGSPAISDANRLYLNHARTVWVRYNASLNVIEASHAIVSHGDLTAFTE